VACRPPPQGSTPLHVASASGHAEAVKLLIAARADLAAKDVCGLCVALAGTDVAELFVEGVGLLGMENGRLNVLSVGCKRDGVDAAHGIL
jgi:ankyrin repeat protein